MTSAIASQKGQPRPETDWALLQWALWEHLGEDAAYADLELNEFREYDGCPMPFNVESDAFDYDQLPLHAATVIAGGTGVVIPNSNHERDWVKLRNVVAIACDDDRTSTRIERAMRAITTRLRGRLNRHQLLQRIGSGAEVGFAFDEGPHAGRDFTRGGPVQQWIWAYTVTLWGPGRAVT